MRHGTHFHIEFEATGSASTFEAMSFDGDADVLAFAQRNLQPGSNLFIACVGNGVDHGNLIIEVDAQGRCDVQAHEHSGFALDGIDLGQAMSVLAHWLPSQERSPCFHWEGK